MRCAILSKDSSVCSSKLGNYKEIASRLITEATEAPPSLFLSPGLSVERRRWSRCVMYFSGPKKHTVLVAKGPLVHRTIFIRWLIDLLYAFLCQRPNPGPGACRQSLVHAGQSLVHAGQSLVLADALPGDPHFQPFIFRGEGSLCSSGYLKHMTLLCWVVSTIYPADTYSLLDSSQRCSKEKFKAKVAGADSLCLSCSPLPQLFRVSSSQPLH